jgi:hypothetical protein
VGEEMQDIATIGDSVFLGDEDSYEKWRDYERLKRALPPMPPTEYEKAIEEICRNLGI